MIEGAKSLCPNDLKTMQSDNELYKSVRRNL